MSRLARILGRGLETAQGISYTEEGNRSIVRLDYRSYLRDPHLLRLFTEYQATGNFTGHLAELSPEEAQVVSRIRESLKTLQKVQKEKQAAYGPMWAGHNEQMLSNALGADPRLFNHIGALSYKSFKPQALGLEAVVLEVLRTLVLQDLLSGSFPEYPGLFTGLNSRTFTLNGKKLSAGLRAFEELSLLQPLIRKIQPAKGALRVLEIGAGSAQLANLLCREGARMVVIDLPGMHARGPYFLYKSSGLKVCTYQQYLEMGRDAEKALERFDVLYLPPWEARDLDLPFHLGVNVHSLSEMSPEEASGYLALIRRSCSHFFSINTNTRGLDPRRQQAYPENSSLSQEKQLGMELAAEGTPLFDAILQKTIHYGYALYRRKGEALREPIARDQEAVRSNP